MKQTGKQVSNHNSVIGEEGSQKGLSGHGEGERGRPGRTSWRKGHVKGDKDEKQELAGHTRWGEEAGVRRGLMDRGDHKTLLSIWETERT